MIKELILKNRSYRRFHQEEKVSRSELEGFVDLARLSGSARNMQSLRYILCNDKDQNEKIFQTLAWAGYLKDWPGPVEGERPAAYIVMLNDEEVSDNYFCDDGIAAQSILLGAVEAGYGGCIIYSVNRPKLTEILSIEKKYKLIQVIALGKPKELVVIDPVDESGDIKYWRDKENVHHVPKRDLRNLIIR